MPTIHVQKLYPDAIIPTRATDGSAGFDLHAYLGDGGIDVHPGRQIVIPTGVAIAIPPGYVGFVCPRSGLSSKMAVTVHNGPGVIDPDYRGPLGVVLHNTGTEVFSAESRDRIAQLVVVPALYVSMNQVDSLEDTVRGRGGFGSSGR